MDILTLKEEFVKRKNRLRSIFLFLRHNKSDIFQVIQRNQRNQDRRALQYLLSRFINNLLAHSLFFLKIIADSKKKP